MSDPVVSPSLPQGVEALIDAEAHRIADGMPSIFKMSADPRSVTIDYIAGGLMKVARAMLEEQGRAQAPAPAKPCPICQHHGGVCHACDGSRLAAPSSPGDPR